MNILDFICIAIMGASIVICSIKGLKKLVFKVSAFIIATIMAKLLGNKFGNLLLSKVIDFDVGALSDKFNDTIISVLGTLIVFLLLFIILKMLFRIVEGKMERSIQSIIVDRLLGALTGLFIGVAFVFVFTEIVYMILTAVSVIRRDTEAISFIDNTIIFKFIKNLN